jgi:hypothetical protein
MAARERRNSGTRVRTHKRFTTRLNRDPQPRVRMLE